MSQKSQRASLLSEYWRSVQTFLKKCIRPSRKEFSASMKHHAIGIGFLGILGYGVKLIHIPINNIIVSSNPNKE
ncbi:protein transport Sec61-like protein [Encephalitozoon intestinalis ATCC 50506]|uniref:Protein transport Sec61-like protein n=1 Tax=Encephalitozoon intestinalis (strain ATCC 50506) TaxID=876142 RepID=E0S7B1_ENCIT|nr:protein transport Sec61-like protein [Encephalitozoon intestinalis ATCC 50506]ADM11539.1 protein transport Sec61-like protein [Encephalitozoon intestinalis ATCC 50506]UTX45253.1 protein translocase subunit SecE [Encephalitozoon intestinalis]